MKIPVGRVNEVLKQAKRQDLEQLMPFQKVNGVKSVKTFYNVKVESLKKAQRKREILL
ncbi:Uncharacterised protein [Streptococcus pneumoniae]|nr:Uncharacterised protein [Streptococcus pneumoniae]